MNGMAAVEVWNLKSVGGKLGSRGFWGKQALKEEEKRATGDSLHGWFPV
jgi:hypothetical protein